jgi:hypothetical protein
MAPAGSRIAEKGRPMIIPYREQCFLRHSARALRTADPRLAFMFAAFAKLATGEAMPGHERVTRRAWAVRVIIAAVTFIAVMAADAVALASRGCHRVARGCMSVCRSLRRRCCRQHPSVPGWGDRSNVQHGHGISLWNS